MHPKLPHPTPPHPGQAGRPLTSMSTESEVHKCRKWPLVVQPHLAAPLVPHSHINGLRNKRRQGRGPHNLAATARAEPS